MKKSLLISIVSFVVALFCAAVLLSPAVAGAENTVTVDVTVKGVQPVIVDSQLCLCVLFEYQGKILSWYEEIAKDEIFDTTKMYRVTIFNYDEVLSAYSV